MSCADRASFRKYVLCGGAIFLSLLITVIALAAALGVCDSGSPRCPHDWIGHRGKCYYVSEKEGNWTSSQSFCSAYGASLAIIEDEEKAFVSKIIGKFPCWIGLRRDSDQHWKWQNGKKFMGVLEGGDCAYLDGEGKPSASRCSTELNWICSKPGVV